MLLSGFFFFGIVFDDRLSWNEQIKQLISKAGKRVGMLGRLRRSLTRESCENKVLPSQINGRTGTTLKAFTNKRTDGENS